MTETGLSFLLSSLPTIMSLALDRLFNGSTYQIWQDLPQVDCHVLQTGDPKKKKKKNPSPHSPPPKKREETSLPLQKKEKNRSMLSLTLNGFYNRLLIKLCKAS